MPEYHVREISFTNDTINQIITRKLQVAENKKEYQNLISNFSLIMKNLASIMQKKTKKKNKKQSLKH